MLFDIEKINLHRGNKLWNSKFMLPEHRAALLKYLRVSQKVEKPELDKQELYEIGIVVIDAFNHELPVFIVYWENGIYMEMECTIYAVDQQEEQIKGKAPNELTQSCIEKIHTFLYI